MTYEQIAKAAVAELHDKHAVSVEIDMHEPSCLLESELKYAFALYDTPERGEEIVNRMIAASLE
jgi:hypothetical protein